MEFSNILLLKKNERFLKPEELFFLKNCGMHYEGQVTNPLMFYSLALSKNINIVLFDPREFDNLNYIVEVLNSLQRFANCYIILCRDIPAEYKANIDVVECNPNITEPIIKISDSLLKVKKMQESNPDRNKQKIFNNIQNILYGLGFDASMMGYNFLCDSVYYVYKNRSCSIKLIADVYKYVAEKNNTNLSNVERDIRHAIEKAITYCDHKKLRENKDLKSFDDIMINTSAKPFILSMVNYLKYNTTFA